MQAFKNSLEFGSPLGIFNRTFSVKIFLKIDIVHALTTKGEIHFSVLPKALLGVRNLGSDP